MQFEKEFEHYKVPEFYDYYFKYNRIKNKISLLKENLSLHYNKKQADKLGKSLQEISFQETYNFKIDEE